MYSEIPTNSDIVRQSLLNVDLIEEHPDVRSVDPERRYESCREPVYGMRHPATPVNQGDLAEAANKVDDIFGPTRPELL